jgi:hypothetical protein
MQLNRDILPGKGNAHKELHLQCGQLSQFAIPCWQRAGQSRACRSTRKHVQVSRQVPAGNHVRTLKKTALTFHRQDASGCALTALVP